MQTAEVRELFDYMYWLNHRILDAAGELDAATFLADEGPTHRPTTRSLHATLVHELDVEWSWRLRLEGRPTGDWGEEAELRPADFPTLDALRRRWAQDEAEMRDWVAGLTDDDLAAPPPAAASVRPRPLWQYLVHILTHAIQQHSDAATLLSSAGRSPGELEFLEYVRETGR